MRLCSYRRRCTALTPEFYADVRAEVESRSHGGVNIQATTSTNMKIHVSGLRLTRRVFKSGKTTERKSLSTTNFRRAWEGGTASASPLARSYQWSCRSQFHYPSSWVRLGSRPLVDHLKHVLDSRGLAVPGWLVGIERRGALVSARLNLPPHMGLIEIRVRFDRAYAGARA
jgi:hypothetical protein